MASLQIPEPYLASLAKISALSDEEFETGILAFQSLPLTIVQNEVFDTSSLSDSLKEIAEPLVGLYLGRVRSQVPLADFLKDVSESLKEGYDESSKSIIDQEGLSKLHERLARLLSIDRLNLIAKASDVLLEHAQTFAKARIVSDIRPVFGESVKEKPLAAVIMHLLNITFYNRGKRKELSVALDVKDIDHMIEILERAKAKSEQLQSLVTSSQMTYINVS